MSHVEHSVCEQQWMFKNRTLCI